MHLLSDTFRPTSYHPLLVSSNKQVLTTTIVELISVSLTIHQHSQLTNPIEIQSTHLLLLLDFVGVPMLMFYRTSTPYGCTYAQKTVRTYDTSLSIVRTSTCIRFSTKICLSTQYNLPCQIPILPITPLTQMNIYSKIAVSTVEPRTQNPRGYCVGYRLKYSIRV